MRLIALGPAAIKPKSVKSLKLQKISIRPVANGHMVTHHYQAKQQQFSFANPKKMATHLKRTIDTEWMHPNAEKEAHKIEGELNI